MADDTIENTMIIYENSEMQNEDDEEKMTCQIIMIRKETIFRT